MDMIFIEILQLNWYAVPELPPSRNPLHNCMRFTYAFLHCAVRLEKQPKRRNVSFRVTVTKY